jgi:hypothetical protein
MLLKIVSNSRSCLIASKYCLYRLYGAFLGGFYNTYNNPSIPLQNDSERITYHSVQKLNEGEGRLLDDVTAALRSFNWLVTRALERLRSPLSMWGKGALNSSITPLSIVFLNHVVYVYCAGFCTSMAIPVP